MRFAPLSLKVYKEKEDKAETGGRYFKDENARLGPTFRAPTSHSKMSGLEIFPHPTCEVKGSGDCECLHPISHMASEKWEVGLKREFPFLKYRPLAMPR